MWTFSSFPGSGDVQQLGHFLGVARGRFGPWVFGQRRFQLRGREFGDGGVLSASLTGEGPRWRHLRMRQVGPAPPLQNGERFTNGEAVW